MSHTQKYILRNTVATLILIICFPIISNDIVPIRHVHIVDQQPDGLQPSLLLASVRNNIWKINKEQDSNKTSQEASWYLVYIDAHSAYIEIVESMQQGLDRLPYKDNLVFYTHGHATSFKNSIEGAFHLSTHYKNTSVIAYDWPSNNRRFQSSINEVYKSVDIHQELLEEFSTVEGFKTKTLFYFSLGNQFFEYLAKSSGLDNIENNSINNIVLNAAAIKSKHHNKWLTQLDICDQVYITTNRGDFPLQGATIARATTQLGKGVVGDQCPKAVYLDFSGIAATEHNYFLGRSKLELEYSQGNRI